MGKSVTFVSDVNGTSVSKTKKRMRGDTNRRPEIKTYDPLSESNNQYAIKICNCCWLRNISSTSVNVNTLYNHSPYRFGWPAQNATATGRVGNSIFLKYVRLKGMIWTSNYIPCGVRWRLCLLKLNGTGLATLSYDSYLSMFIDNTISATATWGTPGTIDNFDNTEDGSLRNFYMKIKNVNEWTGWKRKVIASGYVPPNFVPLEYHGTSVASGSASEVTNYSFHNAADGDAGTEYRHVQPLDIKITLNDRIDCVKWTSIYWLVFESDCGCGFKIDPVLNSRIVSDETYPQGSPLMVHFQARAYYTDS